MGGGRGRECDERNERKVEGGREVRMAVRIRRKRKRDGTREKERREEMKERKGGGEGKDGTREKKLT